MTDQTSTATQIPDAPAQSVTAPAAPAVQTVPLTLEQKIQALDADVAAEFQRLWKWVSVCIGDDVAALGGKTVDQ